MLGASCVYVSGRKCIFVVSHDCPMLIIALSVYQMLPVKPEAFPTPVSTNRKKNCCKKYLKSRACRRCPLAGQCGK